MAVMILLSRAVMGLPVVVVVVVVVDEIIGRRGICLLTLPGTPPAANIWPTITMSVSIEAERPCT